MQGISLDRHTLAAGAKVLHEVMHSGAGASGDGQQHNTSLQDISLQDTLTCSAIAGEFLREIDQDQLDGESSELDEQMAIRATDAIRARDEAARTAGGDDPESGGGGDLDGCDDEAGGGHNISVDAICTALRHGTMTTRSMTRLGVSAPGSSTEHRDQTLRLKRASTNASTEPGCGASTTAVGDVGADLIDTILYTSWNLVNMFNSRKPSHTPLCFTLSIPVATTNKFYAAYGVVPSHMAAFGFADNTRQWLPANLQAVGHFGDDAPAGGASKSVLCRAYYEVPAYNCRALRRLYPQTKESSPSNIAYPPSNAVRFF